MHAPSRCLAGELSQLRPRILCYSRARLKPQTRNGQYRFASGRPSPTKNNPGWSSASRPKPRWQGFAKTGPTTISLVASGGLLSFIGLSAPSTSNHNDDDDDENDESKKTAPTPADTRDPSLPRFRLSEIREHGAESERPWVTRGDKVYDITDWVSAHPGGDVILRAAGGSIDPYWNIFTIHKAPHVYEILSQYQIGFIDMADLVDGLHPPAEAIEDPFHDDPRRDPRLMTLTAKPRNAETPPDALAESFATPNELFYVRNHMWVPRVAAEKADEHTVTIELPDGTEREYTLRELKERFQPVVVTATLQCSGNRRRHMTEGSVRDTQGLQWDVGAISCARWEGVRLIDVLEDAGFPVDQVRRGKLVGGAGADGGDGVEVEARHVQFAGLESYGASIPIGPVLDPRGDVILAYAMNGRPLPRDHGFPLRALVPGHVAARSVKWLKRVVVSDEESHTQWQRRDYKLFGPNVTDPDWDSAPSIQEMPITSAITSVKLGKWVREEAIKEGKETEESNTEKEEGEKSRVSLAGGRRASLAGYAYSGGGRRIIRVDVSLDNGKTWDQAELLEEEQPQGMSSSERAPETAIGERAEGKAWAWKRWRYEGIVPVPDGKTTVKDSNDEGNASKEVPSAKRQRQHPGERCSTLVVKATDESYNAQPDGYEGIWNARGNLANAWHRLKVCSECGKKCGKGGRNDPEDGEGKK